MRTALSIGICACFLIAAPFGRAADRIITPDTDRPGDTRPEVPKYLPEKPAEGLELPPPPSPPGRRADKESFELRGVDFEGNTVFSDEALRDIARPFTGKRVTLSELEELRYRLTRFYVDQGYINSGALIKPNQVVVDGRVTYEIREGRLDAVNITGSGRLRAGYIRKRLRPDPDAPFNVFELQRRFQRLLESPMIAGMRGNIRPGVSAGEAVLDLEVTRARPYQLHLIADNHRPPATGAERLTAAGALWNITGFGDRLDFSYGRSEGADEIAAGFMFPVTAHNTRVNIGYNRSENLVIEEPLAAVDVESDSESLEVGVTHPVYQSPRRALEVGAVLAVRESQTYLLGEPFSFTRGAENGESRVAALRLIQDYSDRSMNTAFAFRSTFSFGLDLFDATVHDGDRPDGEFLAWLGQAQFARRLGERFGQIVLRGDLQLADDRLLSLEQYALGGAATVRGYRENERVRDNAYVLSAEWRYPLWQRTGGEAEEILQLTLFTDYGSAWNKGESAGDDPLHSVGVGFFWRPNRLLDAELILAHDIEEAAEKGDYDIQDEGVQFRVRLSLF